MKLVKLSEICVNETCSKVVIYKCLSDKFLIQNGLKQGDALSPLIFNFALEYAIRKVGLNYRTRHLLVYVDDVNYWWIT
jgi:hypothetical protein